MPIIVDDATTSKVRTPRYPLLPPKTSYFTRSITSGTSFFKASTISFQTASFSFVPSSPEIFAPSLYSYQYRLTHIWHKKYLRLYFIVLPERTVR